MIRNVILHLNNEQPLLADLFEAPSPGDVGLRCTNLRMMNGKRPVFVDDIALDLLLPVPPHPLRRDPAGRDRGRRSASMADAAPMPGQPRPPIGTRGRARSRDRRGLPAAHPRGLRAAGRRIGRTRCYTPGRAKEPRDRRITAKARTIERYLGADYRVLASYGHVRDLPENPGKGKFGVDVDHDFAPEYVISDDRRKQVSEIEKAAKAPTGLPRDRPRPRGRGDRVARRGGGPRPRVKTRRVTFTEITEAAIREAFAHPRQIDMDLVDAQQTRRIVDRLVGYTLSPLLVAEGRRRPVGRCEPCATGAG